MEVYGKDKTTIEVHVSQTAFYAELNRSQNPHIEVMFTGAKATEASFDAYLAGLEANYKGTERITVLFNAEKAGYPQARFQTRQAAWLKENEKLISDRCKGIAYVSPRAIVCHALRFILSVQKQRVPFRVFKHVDAARSWLKTRLSRVMKQHADSDYFII
jgi:hypothetical protein